MHDDTLTDDIASPPPRQHRMLRKIRFLGPTTTDPGTGGRTDHLGAMRRLGALVEVRPDDAGPDDGPAAA
jgi:hypothetical protein